MYFPAQTIPKHHVDYISGLKSECVSCARLIAWSGVHALTVTIPKDVYEFARGDNITLPCSFAPNGKPPLVVITWTAKAKGAKEVRLVFLCVTDYWLFLINGKLGFFPF